MNIILFFFIIIARIKSQKMALVILARGSSQDSINTMQYSLDNELKEKIEFCKDRPQYPTCIPAMYIQKIIVTSNINSALGNIPDNVDSVFISANRITGSINLNLLPSKMDVTISRTSFSSTLLESNPSDFFDTFINKMSQVSYNGSIESQVTLANALSSSKRNPKAKYENEIDLPGNINNKVSFLIIIGFSINIIGSSLNCENAYFSSCTFGVTDYGIITKYLIVDPYTSKYITYEDGLNKVSQYCIYRPDEDCSFRISYTSTQWVLKETYFIDSYNDVAKVSYKMADKFCLITYGKALDIHRDFDTIGEIKPINVTIMETININQPILEKKNFVITVTGWGSTQKPKIDVIFDKNDVTVEQDGKTLDGDGKDEDDDEKLIKNICIAAIVVACVIVIVVVIVVVVCVVKKKKMKNAQKDSIGEDSPDQENENI